LFTDLLLNLVLKSLLLLWSAIQEYRPRPRVLLLAIFLVGLVDHLIDFVLPKNLADTSNTTPGECVEPPF